MNSQRIAEILIPWTNRHGLRISDIYRDQFWYIDIVDDTGGEYEISIFQDEQPDLIKVRVHSNRKRSCGFIGVVPADLERVLEKPTRE